MSDEPQVDYDERGYRTNDNESYGAEDLEAASPAGSHAENPQYLDQLPVTAEDVADRPADEVLALLVDPNCPDEVAAAIGDALEQGLISLRGE